MSTITVDQIVTTDGFAAEPDGGMDFSGAHVDDGSAEQAQLRWLESVDAIVLGRATYEMFVEFWPTADPAQHPVAAWINAAPKHVVSNTLDRAPWGDGEVEMLRDGPAAAAETLRARHDSVVVWGSLQLTGALFLAGQVDVLRLRTVPVLIGEGRGFAPSSLGRQRLAAESSTAHSPGHVTTEYRVLR